MKKLARSVTALLLAALMVLSLAPGAFAASDFAGGSGTQASPYLISTKAQLNKVREYPDAYFKLTADISFSAADFKSGGSYYNGGAGWTPIGNSSSRFSGVFDGNGHSITGLVVKVTASDGACGGLFGHADGAVIKNLGMVDSDIRVSATSGYLYAGSIVGYGYGVTLTNCYQTGKVSTTSSDGTEHAGGIAGYVHAYSAITGCYNTGSVGSSAYAGGIAGYASSTPITNCYSTGAISGEYAGGIAGDTSGTQITNCYNKGTITGHYFAGGIAGSTLDSTVTKSYNAGAVTGEYAGGIAAYLYDSADISNCYNTGSICGISGETDFDYCGTAGGIAGYMSESDNKLTNCYNTGAVSGYNCAGGIAGEAGGPVQNCYNTGIVSCDYTLGGIAGEAGGTIQNCYYLDYSGTGLGSGNDTAVKYNLEQLKTQSSFAGFDFFSVWKMGDGAQYPLPTLRDIKHAEGSAVNTTEFAGGNGTAHSPYLVNTKAQLNNVRKYPGAYFKMTADISFSAADFQSGGSYYNGGAGWTPIGDTYIPFTCVFDGGGHTVTGLYINAEEAYDFCAGLFGYVKCSSIMNLAMEDSKIIVADDVYGFTGSIAGYAYMSVISNCSNSGSLSGGNYAGGITGYAYNHTAILNCCNTADIISSYEAGGIVGDAYYGSIVGCYNTGAVSSECAGGVAGASFSSTATDCYNTGTVSDTGDSSSYAAGIVGYVYESMFTNVYNAGSISSTGESEYVGGLAGYSDNSTFTNCYHLNNISKGIGYGTNAGTKCTSAQLATRATFVGFDFADVWMISSTTPYRYPTLRHFAVFEIISQPENVTAEEGKNVSFSVEASGKDLSYQWQFSRNGGSTWSNNSCTTATFSVSATASRDGYMYRCVVTDGSGNKVTSKAATLTLKAGPAITTQPKNMAAAAGKNVSFTVTATGSNLSYQWQYSSNGGKSWANSPATGNKTASLTVTATASRDGNQYRCVVTDGSGNKVTSKAATLTLKAGPTITTQPKSVTKATGETARFTVTATGSNLSYQWQYSSNGGKSWANSPATGNKTASLTVTATASRDGNLYRCVVTDGSGNQVTTNAATLTVG